MPSEADHLGAYMREVASRMGRPGASHLDLVSSVLVDQLRECIKKLDALAFNLAQGAVSEAHVRREVLDVVEDLLEVGE
jgi:hypothetical protein